MSLWNIIRDFFVQYIFGGTTSSGNSFSNTLGAFINENTLYDATEQIYLPINAYAGDYGLKMEYFSLSDWLSTTATIITLCGICFFLFLFVRWLFRLTANLIQFRG